MPPKISADTVNLNGTGYSIIRNVQGTIKKTMHSQQPYVVQVGTSGYRSLFWIYEDSIIANAYNTGRYLYPEQIRIHNEKRIDVEVAAQMWIPVGEEHIATIGSFAHFANHPDFVALVWALTFLRKW